MTSVWLFEESPRISWMLLTSTKGRLKVRGCEFKALIAASTRGPRGGGHAMRMHAHDQYPVAWPVSGLLVTDELMAVLPLHTS